MSSSSSSDDRSHHGGAKLVPQPRRQPSKAQIPPPAPAKESTHRKLQAAQVNDPDSPTPLPRGQRTAERAATQPTAVQPIPFPYQGQMMMPTIMGYPVGMAKPGFSGVPSDSSASSGYYHVRMPPVATGYPNYVVPPQTGHQMVLASQATQTSGSVDAIAAGVGGMKLRGYQEEADKYIRHVQEQIFTIIRRTYETEGLPHKFFQNLDRALKQLTQDLGNLQGFVDRVATEADKAKNKDNESQTFQATAGMQAVEIERLRSSCEQLRLSLSGSEKNNEEIQETYQNIILSLQQQYERAQHKVTELQEQLEGKRHLFYTAHDDVEGKARILSMVADNDYLEKAKIIQHLIDSANPQDKARILEVLFSKNAQAPVHNRSVSYQVPNMIAAIQGAAATPAADVAWAARRPSRVTPPAPNMRRTPSSFNQGSLVRPPTMGGRGYSQPRPGPPGSIRPVAHGHAGPNAARYKFDDTDDSSAPEYGSPTQPSARQQVVTQAQAEWTQHIERWKEEFSKIWCLVHGWATRHAAHVEPNQDQAIQAEAPRLWEFMCEILYPSQPEAGASHARFLLEDEQCRPYFVERMMLQYVVNNILSVEGWMGFSEETDRELKELQNRLLRTEVFKSYIRQSINDQINTVLSRMLAHPEFSEYRARRISFHQQRLKTIVGPLMDSVASRNDASFDLHAVASTALQVSALMFQSRLNFEFTWSHTCSKFSVEFHVPKEPPLDPLMLQQKQYRLKLVVTPAIVFRDDRGASATVKRVLRSEVFVMN
ncbi:hypothetical protein GE09DRAFT_1048585 [Coniochaeta sp. 2T2.1]|nr:hypothetical protein GE09DRAFT_1048585 [Coniochaeta sp. 2T2.1]